MTNKIRSKKLASKKAQKKANPKASHDNFFKRVMGNPLTACELLEEYCLVHDKKVNIALSPLSYMGLRSIIYQ